MHSVPAEMLPKAFSFVCVVTCWLLPNDDPLDCISTSGEYSNFLYGNTSFSMHVITFDAQTCFPWTEIVQPGQFFHAMSLVLAHRSTAVVGLYAVRAYSVRSCVPGPAGV